MRNFKDNRYIIMAMVAGLLLGAVWLLAVRAVLAKNTEPHYHANFAVFVNGQRLKFEGPTFYEEVTACNSGGSDPKTRVHMHDNIGHIVHIHDQNVTWAHFFANLRYGLSDKSLALDEEVLVDGQNGNRLAFILNGEEVANVANKIIGSEDKLLVSYGPEDENRLDQEYSQVENDAAEYNKRTDPSACTGGKPLTIKQRLKRALSVN